MFTFSSSEQYESFCKDVFEGGRGYVNVQKYGRSGQSQDGIDLIGYRPDRISRVGVQCKWYEKVTPKLRDIIDGDIVSARAINPPIVHLYICVDADEDRELTNLVARHHADNNTAGRFPITLISRDDFHSEAARIPKIIEKYAPETFQAIRKATSESIETDFAQTLVNGLQVKGLPLQTGDIGLRPQALASRIAACAESVHEKLIAANEEIQSLVRSAEDAIAAAQPESALDFTARALEMSPGLSLENRAAVLKQRGRAFASCNRKAEAIECYEQYLETQVGAQDAPARRAVVAWLKGDLEDMRRLAVEALGVEGSADLALALLIDNCESDAQLEALLHDHQNLLKTGVTANQAASKVHLERRRFSNAAKFAKYALDLRPGDLRNKCQYAICRLLETLSADGMTAISALSSELHQAAAEAEKVFAGLWSIAKQATDEHLIVEVAQFYAMALTILGRIDEAVQVLAGVPEPIQSERLTLWRARLSLLKGDAANAMELLGQIVDPELVEEAKWLRLTGAMNSQQVDEALGLIDELSVDVKDVFRVEGLQHQKALLLLEDRADEALAVANSLGKEDASPNAKLYAAHILTLLEDKDAADGLVSSALEAINGGTAVDRDAAFLAARFAEERGHLVTSVRCLEWAANSANDNSALRLLLRALSHLGQSKRVETIIAALPESVRKDPYYIEIEARRYEAAGNADKALVLLEGYGDPKDRGFSLAVARLQLLIRQDRKGQARATAGDLLRKVVAALSQEGEDAQRICRHLLPALPKLVQLGTSLGHEALALQAAMLSLSIFVGQPAIELMYSFATLQCKPIAISRLSEGSSAQVELADGRIASVVVCPAGTDFKRFLAQFPLAYSLTASEAAATGALGTTTGDQIRFDSRDGSLTGEIKEIAEAHFALHSLIFSTFEVRYPGQRALQMIPIEHKEDGTPDFTAVFRMLDGIEERRERAFEIYKSHPVPLVFVAHFFKMAPVELWEQIVGIPGRWFFTWGGGLNELIRRVSALQETPTIVIEPLTLVTWWRTGKLDLLMRLPGRILIAPSSLDVIQKLIETVENRRNSLGSLGKVGAQYVRHDTNPDEIEYTLKNLQDLKDWVETRCEIIVVAADTSNNEMLSLLYQVSEPTAHALKLAQQESALLWVDDLRVAQLAELNSWAKCACWHVLLEALARRGMANEDEVAETLAIVAQANYTFVHVSVTSLCAAAKDDQMGVGWKTRALLDSLRQEIDWRSSMKVFLIFIDEILQSRVVPFRVAKGYVRIGLSAITKDATRYVQNTLDVMATRTNLASAVDEWKRGHFIPSIGPGVLPGRAKRR